MSGFRELNVWQLGKELAVSIYKITAAGAFKSDFGLRDQIRRATVSIPSNIAEGDERGSNKDAVRFLYIAKGSLAELQTQLIIAHEIGYIDSTTLKDIDEKCQTLGKMIGSLIKARTSTLNP
jgi:four helix bundle protein